MTDPDRHYKILIDHSPDAIVVHEGRRLVFANPAALRLVGAQSPGQVVGHLFSEFVDQGSLGALRERIATLEVEGVPSTPTEMTLRCIGGRQTPVESRSVLTLWEGRRAYLAVLRDLSAQRAAERAAAAAEHQFASVVSTLAEGVVVQDPDGIVQSINAAAARALGVDPVAVVGRDLPRELVGAITVVDAGGRPVSHADLPHVITSRTGRPTRFLLGVTRPDGTQVWLRGTSALIDDHPLSHLVASFTDITAERTAAAQLAYQATHDSLTDLPNRLHVVSVLTETVASAERGPIAVLYVDLDNLKTINDTFGHSIGDAVLREVANRLRAVVPEGCQVGRVGGDEFVVLLAGAAADTDVVSDAVHVALSRPLELDGWTMGVGASIGHVLVPQGDGRTIDDLLRDADLAMYAAKEAGGNRTVRFSSERAH
ncbi:diguanylate cyclase domain-containing protein [Williamsia sp. MIQD14]|uniref:diguanylate cyclase domain-containing protein n=1 Tax=Williamsia sp. MIQD14 TaxID=3425703 RepID=UPI003DA1B0D7